MEPQSPTAFGIIPQDLNQQNPNSSSPNFLKWTLLVLLAVAIIAFGLFFLGNIKVKKQLTGFEVASKTSLFLDKTLQSDGSFLSGFICDDSLPDKCARVADVAEHSGQAILAYYFLGKTTGNLAFKEKADRAMSFALEKCKSDPRFCELNYFALMQYYRDTREDRYLSEGMLPVAPRFLTLSDEEVVLEQVGTKFAGLFDVTGETRYKDRLLQVADSELLRGEENAGRADYNMQLIWSVYLPAYRLTNDSKYLDAIEIFFNNLDATQFAQPYSMSKAASVWLDLWEATGNKIYKAKAHDIMQKMLTELWDSPYHPMFTADYGFIDTSEFSKYMIFNGGIIQQFLKLGNEKFDI